MTRSCFGITCLPRASKGELRLIKVTSNWLTFVLLSSYWCHTVIHGYTQCPINGWIKSYLMDTPNLVLLMSYCYPWLHTVSNQWLDQVIPYGYTKPQKIWGVLGGEFRHQVKPITTGRTTYSVTGVLKRFVYHWLQSFSF